MRLIPTLCRLAACCALFPLAASAQEVIHAMEGTVQNIDTKGGSITVTNNNGTGGSFKEASWQVAPSSVERDLRAAVVSPKQFTANGDQVVLLYQGYGDLRTAIAIHDLGKGTITATKGVVERYDKHAHRLTLKSDADGKEISLSIGAATIADGASGVTDGFKFEASKGDHLKIAAAQDNGTITAVFIGFAD